MKKIVNFFFELSHLKMVKHEGWKIAGIKDPDSVAEHSLNAAQIGYILAKMEGADANKVATMLVWHDIAETRIGDLHKIATRYIKNKQEIEDNVMKDQLEGIIGNEDIMDLFKQYEERSTLEGLIAKDADYLEQAFQGKIYVECGYTSAQDWIDNVGKALKTQSAKLIWTEMTKSKFINWWKETYLKDLSKI